MATMRDDANDWNDWNDRSDPRSDRSDYRTPNQHYSLYGEFGEFGVTSDEIPALSRAQQARIQAQRAQWEVEQRSLWEREQLKRAQIMRKVEKLYHWHAISGIGYDLLQAEFSRGLLPDVYWDDEMGGYLVWSAYERRRWTLYSWERHARELLSNQLAEQQTIHLRQTPRPWAPIFDSKLDPQRRTPGTLATAQQPQRTQQAQQTMQARPTPRLDARNLIDDESVRWQTGDLQDLGDDLEMGQPAPATRRLLPEER